MSHPLYKQFKPKQLTLRDKTEELQEAQVQAIDMMGGIPNPRGKLSASSIINPRTARGAEYFGDGSDGALYIRAGQTVTLPVPVPHQMVIEKNYTTVTIENGGILECADNNAGLVLRITGNLTNYGTISQDAKAPKSNPYNNYAYPVGLQCGNGGNGGHSRSSGGGLGQSARTYGGGYGGGGGGAEGNTAASRSGPGGDSTGITINTPMFVGGTGQGGAGSFGGGGAGGRGSHGGYTPACPGASGAGSNGNWYHEKGTSSGCSGGAGHYGGGVIIIYCGGDLRNYGTLTAVGGNGGLSLYTNYQGGGGGGGGGGGIYLRHGKSYTNQGAARVLGGNGGVQSGAAGSAGGFSASAAPPEVLPHNITCQPASNGSITTSKNNAPAGTWISINVYPASGYKFTPGSLRLNGQPISGSGFNMPAYDVTVSASFELADSTGPSMSVTTQQTWSSYSNTATISASDPSGVAGYSMDNTSSWTGNNVFTFYSNGGHTVYTKDGNGNISSARFTIDHIDSNDPMIGTVTSVGGNGWIADGPRAVDVSASDVGSGVASYAIKSDHNWGNGFQPSNRFYLAAGNYFVRVQDHAGRMSSEFPITVNNIDTEKPRVDSVKLLPEGWTTQSDKQIVITASDSQSGLAEFGISNDGVKWTWQTGNSFVKSKGKYQIQVKDKVGKLSLTQEVDVSGIDVLPPVINDVEIPVEWGRTATVKVIAVDEGAGVKDYTITSGRTPAEEDFKPSNEFVITQNGEYWAWARDKLGQRSLGKKFNVTKIDTQPPGMGEIAVGAPYGNMLEFNLKSGVDFGASSGVHVQIQRNNEPEEALGVEAKVYVSYGDSWKVWTQDGVGNKSEVQWIYSQAPTAVPVLGWWKQLARVRFANGKQYCEKDSGSVSSVAVPMDASRRVFGIKDGVTTPVQGVAGVDQQVSTVGLTSVMGITWLNDKDGVLARFGDYTLESEMGKLVIKGKVSKQEICSHKPEQMVDLLITHKLGEKLFEIQVDGVVQGVQTPTVPVGNDYLDFLQSGVGLANAQLWEVAKEANGESGIISVIPNSCVTQMLHGGVVISNREGATPITKAGNYSWEIKSSTKGGGVTVRYTLPAAVPTIPDVSCETEKQGVITPPVE